MVGVSVILPSHLAIRVKGPSFDPTIKCNIIQLHPYFRIEHAIVCWGLVQQSTGCINGISNLLLRPAGFIIVFIWLEIFDSSVIIIQLLRWVIDISNLLSNKVSNDRRFDCSLGLVNSPGWSGLTE